MDFKGNFMSLMAQVYGKQDVVVRHYAGIPKPWTPKSAVADKEFWEKYKVNKLIAE